MHVSHWEQEINRKRQEKKDFFLKDKKKEEDKEEEKVNFCLKNTNHTNC